MQNNQIDPGLADYAQQWDNAMQRAFKGIRTRAERRRSMQASMRRRAQEQQEQADA